MPTKGRSNLYGRGKHGEADSKIGFKYAKYFREKYKEDHIIKHGLNEMGVTPSQYISRAVSFANKVDRINHDSFVKSTGDTLKYSYLTKEFVVVSKDGLIKTYYVTTDKWWEKEKEKYEKS